MASAATYRRGCNHGGVLLGNSAPHRYVDGGPGHVSMTKAEAAVLFHRIVYSGKEGMTITRAQIPCFLMESVAADGAGHWLEHGDHSSLKSFLGASDGDVLLGTFKCSGRKLAHDASKQTCKMTSKHRGPVIVTSTI